ncbi:hypothetical protein Tco_0435550 [Tanacetum coccineum]
MIAEKKVKKISRTLYPSDFEDLNLLLLQGHLDHLPGSDVKRIANAIYCCQAMDPKLSDSTAAVVFSVDNNDRKIMRFNEIYKFCDGTLTHILEALDYKVKEFKTLPVENGLAQLLNTVYGNLRILPDHSYIHIEGRGSVRFCNLIQRM